jgi:hypothetical protein
MEQQPVTRKVRVKMTLAQVNEAKKLFETGAFTLRELAEKFDVSVSYIKMLTDGKLPKRVQREIAKQNLHLD